MESITNIIEFIKSHWNDILTVYGAIVAVCTVIVRLTPSVKDNEILEKVLKFVDLFSTAFLKDDKDKLKDK